MGGGGAESEVSSSLPTVAWDELSIGRLVGKGGFSLVKEVSDVQLKEVYDLSEEDAKHRKAFAEAYSRLGHQHKYVIKMLRDDLPEDEHTKGVVDLAIEADFLEHLSHPNIITMRATANSDPYESKFFVILDRLLMTLERKMNYWRKDVGANIGFWMGPCGYCCAKKHELRRIWTERLRVTRDIASALQYLHDQDVVYRDLKPDNVGFDAKGDVKIFDFGLAKRLDPYDKFDDELYKLTGNTGSLRYMAPEIANNCPYNQLVDSYSFGILFWQICSLTTPFAGYTTKMHSERVVKQEIRPKIDSSWPNTWSSLMKDCWAAEISKRPDFGKIVLILDAEVNELLEEAGVVPSHAGEIRAKQHKIKKTKVGEQRLDVDTRIHTDDDSNVKRYETDVV